MKVDAYLGIGYAGAEHRETLTFDDDATEAEIDESVSEWANNYIDIGWKKQ